MSFKEIFPPIENAMEMEPEELAVFVLRYLNGQSNINRYNFLLGTNPELVGYAGEKRKELLERLSPAWMWLEKELFLAPKPGESGDWRIITPKGKRFLEEQNLDTHKEDLSHKDAKIKKDAIKYDVFICHASEDKKYVDELANALENNRITTWYDSFQMGWGDDLRPNIDSGLKNSRFGIVVFSKAFLSKKKWTEYELNGLFSKEKSGKKVILPIWHNISREDISQYSLTFADRIAKRSDDIDSIVKELKKLLK